ncbi:MAG: DUF5050 domain-containing protein [Candidatus Pacebacteria bacterium]|nr:DUF5050 domain-containing protein [Candidatus Paceibacterota bacterium]
MNKKIRTAIFAFFVLAFLAIAPVIVFYSQGYRYDWQTKSILKIGGVYIKTTFSNANIFIDGKYASRTAALSHDLLIQDLTAKEHNIRVEAAGYRTWEKNLFVKEKMVTQAYVIPFPEEIGLIKTAENVSKIYSFPEQNKIIIIDTTGQIFSFESGQTTLLLGKAAKDISKIADIVASPDGSRIIVKATEIKTGKIKFYLLPTNKETLSLAALKTLDKTTAKVFFYSNNIIYFDVAGKLYKEPLDTQKQTLVTTNAISAFYLQNDNLYFLQDGLLIRQNVLTNTQEQLLQEPIEINPETSYDVFVYWEKVFLLENKKTLHVLDGEQKELEPLISSNSEIKYTGFSDKLLFFNNTDLWLYLLRDYESPFFAEAGTLIKISSYGKINGIEWLGGEYFALMDENNKVQISEIDNRDRLNSFELSQDVASQIWFDRNEKKLYILSQNNLLASPKLIP